MNDWMHEIIDTPYGDARRHEMIDAFVDDLIPFVESMGYTWANTSAVATRLATGLFANRGKHYIESDWSMIPNENVQSDPEDLYHFHHILDGNIWTRFWSAWGEWADVSLETNRGSDRRLDIQDFVWKQLDILKSPQTDIVNGLCGCDDFEEDDRELEWNEAL